MRWYGRRVAQRRRRTGLLPCHRRANQHRYGASFNGLAALLGMLNSCASNVTVVNIDNVSARAMSPASSPDLKRQFLRK